MNTESIPLKDLLPDPANARLHSAQNIDAIKASLKRFGQQKPIVVDGDNIVRAGNGTLVAATALGWDTIECVRSGLTGTEMTAFAIADNRSAELAEWDYEVLGQVLSALQEEEPNRGVELGWAEHQLVNILAADWEPPTPSDGDLEDFTGVGGGTAGADQAAPVPRGGEMAISFSEEDIRQIEECGLILSPDEELPKHRIIMQLVRARLQG